MATTAQQFATILAKLDRIEQGGAKPVRPARNIEDDLRALAADWMETETHRVYGQTILDILDGN